ncbi:MAG: hypothetical protein JSV25_13075 [Spirochaetota bacterium]|nr:MAG: hypothetical protein JSV25_13075 [Spirochaetota bacterium]
MFRLKSIYHHLVWVFRGVHVFALVGKSGTGKSFRAQLVSKKYGIDLIIDDGLLIKDQSIIAGKSAKKEKARLTAIKRALFLDPAHAEDVKAALRMERFKRILIIGTSEKMVRKIAQRMDLPNPHRIININDVATQQEIEIAQRSRTHEGKHIIPVPSVEVKRNYPHIFFDSVKIFIRKNLRLKKSEQFIEKSVVTPEFSDRGRISISESSLSQMVIHCVNEFDPSLRILKIIIRQDRHNFGINVILDIPYGTQITGKIHNLQKYILENIEKFTGIILLDVNITIGKVSEAEEGIQILKADR